MDSGAQRFVAFQKTYWHTQGLAYTPATEEEVLNSIARITTRSVEAVYVWRGQADIAWDLTPGVVRRLAANGSSIPRTSDSLAAAHEAKMIHLARRSGFIPETSALESLAILQHHGAATRLLDVTSDPMISLFFACEYPRDDGVDGVLFAIDVSKAVLAEDNATSWEDTLAALPPDRVGIYTPRAVDERIKVQRGRFIYSHLDARRPSQLSLPLELSNWKVGDAKTFFEAKREGGRPTFPSILAIRVKAALKPRIRALLKNSYGYTHSSIYPDLDGFAEANGAAAVFDADSRPTFELGSDEGRMFLPVQLPEGSAAAARAAGSAANLLRIADRGLSLGRQRVDNWNAAPDTAPRYWLAYQANEVVGCFSIAPGSWTVNDGRWSSRLAECDSPEVLDRVIGRQLTHNGMLVNTIGRAFFAVHLD